MSYLSDIDYLDMTGSDFVNALKIFIGSEKHPVSRANHGYAKKASIDRWLTIETLTTAQFSANFDIWYDIPSPIIRFRG